MISAYEAHQTFTKAFESDVVRMWMTFVHYQSHRRGHILPDMRKSWRPHARIIWRQLNWFMNHGTGRYQSP